METETQHTLLQQEQEALSEGSLQCMWIGGIGMAKSRTPMLQPPSK